MLDELTEEQKLVLTGYTLDLYVDFEKFHEDIEKRLGKSIHTHMIPRLEEDIQEAYKEDFEKMIGAKLGEIGP